MPTRGQIIACAFIVALWVTFTIAPPLMQPLKPYLPDCKYIAFGACVTRRAN